MTIREQNVRKDIDSKDSIVLMAGNWFETGDEVVDEDGFFFAETCDGDFVFRSISTVEDVIVIINIDNANHEPTGIDPSLLG